MIISSLNMTKNGYSEDTFYSGNKALLDSVLLIDWCPFLIIVASQSEWIIKGWMIVSINNKPAHKIDIGGLSEDQRTQSAHVRDGPCMITIGSDPEQEICQARAQVQLKLGGL